MGISSSTGIEDAVVKVVHGWLGIIGPLVGRCDIKSLVIDRISSVVEATVVSVVRSQVRLTFGSC